MGTFLYQYGWVIVVIVGFIVALIYTYKTKGQDVMFAELREDLYKLMLLAEKKFGNDGIGAEKFSWVIEKVYKLFPSTLQFFVSQEDFEYFVQDVYDDTKDFLDDGEINESV